MQTKHVCKSLVGVLRITGALLASMLLASTAIAVAPDAPALWRPVATTAKPAPTREVMRTRAIVVDVERLRSARNLRFSLPLPDGGVLVVTKVRESKIGERGYTWHGKIEGDPMGTASFAVVGQAVVGDILGSKGRAYRVRYGGQRGTHVVERIDPSKYPAEADPVPVEGRRLNDADEGADTCATDGPNQIDILVAYTQTAQTAAGGVDAMQATVFQAVELTNQSYINSNINQRLNLVHMVEEAYAETGVSATDLSNLRTKADGNLDDVHTLRDTHAADAVVLITESLDACGRAYLMTSVGNAFESSAFGVVARNCATGNLSFGHELGHNMSARHDWAVDSTNNSPYAFNHGHVQPVPTTVGVTPWRTVMAYNNACTAAGVNCTRLPFWSNPLVAVSGDATGTAAGAQQEDNRQTLNNTAPTVANFRCSSPGRNDVWMKDTWSDAGAEPDPSQALLAMWQSPYIWVRNQQDVGLTHAHAHEHQNPELGQGNFAYVKLHNGGAATAGTLELYAAPAATGLSWPTDWTLVKSVAVSSIAAHAAHVVEADWSPSAAGHYCLLARWVSPTDPMTVAETTNVDGNTRANNNIVWRNVNVVDLIADGGDQVSLIVRNTERRKMIASLAIRPSGADSFLKFGRIELQLDARLRAAWNRGDLRGTGFKAKGKTLTVVDPKGAVLEGLALEPGFEGKLGLTFRRPADGYPRGKFTIDVVQSETERERTRAIGGVSYEVYTARADR